MVYNIYIIISKYYYIYIYILYIYILNISHSTACSIDDAIEIQHQFNHIYSALATKLLK